jgi:hypothetical protein
VSIPTTAHALLCIQSLTHDLRRNAGDDWRSSRLPTESTASTTAPSTALAGVAALCLRFRSEAGAASAAARRLLRVHGVEDGAMNTLVE